MGPRTVARTTLDMFSRTLLWKIVKQSLRYSAKRWFGRDLWRRCICSTNRKNGWSINQWLWMRKVSNMHVAYIPKIQIQSSSSSSEVRAPAPGWSPHQGGEPLIYSTIDGLSPLAPLYHPVWALWHLEHHTTHTHTHTHTSMHAHTHTHTHKHACTHTHTHNMHAHTCTRTHTHTHTQACMCVHAHTHTHTHTHIRPQACAHNQTDMDIQMCVCTNKHFAVCLSIGQIRPHSGKWLRPSHSPPGPIDFLCTQNHPGPHPDPSVHAHTHACTCTDTHTCTLSNSPCFSINSWKISDILRRALKLPSACVVRLAGQQCAGKLSPCPLCACMCVCTCVRVCDHAWLTKCAYAPSLFPRILCLISKLDFHFWKSFTRDGMFREMD